MSPDMQKKFTIRHLSKLVILLGIVLVAITIFIVKYQISETPPSTDETIEQQLDRYFKSGQPVFAFIHSTTCKSCINMMQTVDQVYPEFAAEIALVDIDVYDPENDAFLDRAKVSYIPTQIFFDPSGTGNVVIGEMTSNDLRQSLLELMERNH